MTFVLRVFVGLRDVVFPRLVVVGVWVLIGLMRRLLGVCMYG